MDVLRPRIAVAPDGSSAVAFEALLEDGSQRDWVVLVQRYTASGQRAGPIQVFRGESCGGLDLWLDDLVDFPELAFTSNGLLAVSMQHRGEFVIGTDGLPSSEITLGVIDPQGQRVDVNGSTSCTQKKIFFSGGGRQDWPRMEVPPNGFIFITAEGFFNDADVRNVAIQVLQPDGTELIQQVIPHADPQSQQASHRFPDIASNGTLALAVWNRGRFENGEVVDWDVEAQFASLSGSSLTTVNGGNQLVNEGAPAGSVQLFASAAMNAAGQSVVVWADARDNAEGEIYGQRFDAGGRKVGGNFRISASEGTLADRMEFTRPEVAMQDDGRFMVVWTDTTTGTATARGRRYNADGTPDGPPFKLAGSFGGITGLPHVVAAGNDFAYLWAANQNGQQNVFSNLLAPVLTGTEREPNEQEQASLIVFPNPVTERASVRYVVAEPGPVTVRVYDVLGRRVANLFAGPSSSGEQSVALDGSVLGSGVYLVEVIQGTKRQTRLFVRL